jgi:hypothetical protein
MQPFYARKPPVPEGMGGFCAGRQQHDCAQQDNQNVLFHNITSIRFALHK